MKQKIVYNNGLFLSYDEYGDENGFPILINHGLIASINDHDLFESLIQRGAHLVSIARPGYGESSPYVMQNIAEWAYLVSLVIDELHISQFDILGMSSGAPYSYAVGYKFPDRVRNIYIFSGVPALYDEQVQSLWPFGISKNASIADMQSLAHDLFFSNVSQEDLQKSDIQDSMMNNCFGIAQELKLRCMDWGFNLSDVSSTVYMQHSKQDQNVPLITASLTAGMLPNCKLEIREAGEHFSKGSLDEFIRTTMVANLQKEPRESRV